LEQLALEFRTETDPELLGLRMAVPPEHAEGQAPTLTTTSVSAMRRNVQEMEGERTELVQFLYGKLLDIQPRVKEGNAEALEDWLDIADALLREFRSNNVFYPFQRNIVFLGYSREAQRKAGKYKNRTLMDEMQEMASRLQESLGM
jgi:general transcription factor 3C polypeptide 3 (transcription factor C subunit 4)